MQVAYKAKLIGKKSLPALRTNSLTKYLYQISWKSISSNIQEQINEDIIEKVNKNKTLKTGKEFYLQHRPVIQEFAETTKKIKPNKIKILYLLMNGKKPVSHCKVQGWIF